MLKKSTVIQDEITAEISKLFDYEFNGTTEFLVEKIDLPLDTYSIGLIVGPSGSGKSSMLCQFGEEEKIVWEKNKAICSHFINAETAKNRLSAVGLNSIPVWMKPYDVLSTGEKFRADLAIKLKNNAVIDEFTSVIDRNVAKSCSYAIRRYVDENNLNNIVFSSCHYDIIDWLQPDWVFDTSTKKLVVGRGLLRQPKIQLEIIPCSTEAWSIFRNHHYLSGDINKSSRCWFAIWEGTVIGFAAAIANPSGTLKNAWRGHRTVILPDFQGLGLGVRLSDAIGEIFIQNQCRYFSKSAHPRLGEYRNKSAHWRPTSKNQKNRLDYKEERKTKSSKNKMVHSTRVCYSHEYIGRI